MSIEQIICDGCGRDITYTTNSVDWRIALVNEAIPIKPGIDSVTDVYITPVLDRNKDFCGPRCLKNWVDAEWYPNSGPISGLKTPPIDKSQDPTP